MMMASSEPRLTRLRLQVMLQVSASTLVNWAGLHSSRARYLPESRDEEGRVFYKEEDFQRFLERNPKYKEQYISYLVERAKAAHEVLNQQHSDIPQTLQALVQTVKVLAEFQISQFDERQTNDLHT